MPDTSVTPAGAQIIAVVTLTLFAFQGMECATIPADRVADPARTIPRATVWGTLVTAVVYVACTIGVMSLVPADVLATSTAPFADGAMRMFGAVGARIVALGAALSCLGALNGWVLAAGQLPVAVAADGLVPPALGRLSARGTPAVALIVAGVLASALVAMNYSRGLVGMYTFVVLLSTMTSVVAYVFCALAVWVMPGHSAPAGVAAVVSAVAFAYALAAVAGAGADTVYYGFLMLLAGLPLLVWVRRGRSVAALGEPDPEPEDAVMTDDAESVARLNAVGILTRREIEARILAPVLDALGQEFGRARVIEVAREAVAAIAREQGRPWRRAATRRCRRSSRGGSRGPAPAPSRCTSSRTPSSVSPST